jgi:hypothetical protein
MNNRICFVACNIDVFRVHCESVNRQGSPNTMAGECLLTLEEINITFLVRHTIVLKIIFKNINI